MPFFDRLLEGVFSCSGNRLHEVNQQESPAAPQHLDASRQQTGKYRCFNRQAEPTIIQPSSVGHLKERALALSEEIMVDLDKHGWVPSSFSQFPKPGWFAVRLYPTDPEEIHKWHQARSVYFRKRFLEKVLDLRNEFSQLHLRDKCLDNFFDEEDMIQDVNRRLATVGKAERIDVFLSAPEIEEVAERLRVLAEQIK